MVDIEPDDPEKTRKLDMHSEVLGAYPYILIQFEPHNGSWRIGMDYGLLDEQEVLDIMRELVADTEDRGWNVTN